MSIQEIETQIGKSVVGLPKDFDKTQSLPILTTEEELETMIGIYYTYDGDTEVYYNDPSED